MPPLPVVQRVDVGHQVAAGAVGVDQLEHAGGLVHRALGNVLGPAHRLVRDAQRGEDVVEEPVLAQQELVHPAQEVAGLRTLDDPVVVGGRERHDLADAHVDQRLLAGALELRRVVHGSDADDRALPLGQPRHRMVGAGRAGVGQRDRGAREVVRGQRVVAGLADDVFIGLPELLERHVLAALDGGDHEVARTVLARQVDGQAQVDVLGRDGCGLALGVLAVVAVHVREVLDRPDQRVADQVGEGDLAALVPLEVVVDDDAVVEQQLRRHRAHARRGRHRERLVHVLGDRSRSPAECFDVATGLGLLHRSRLGGLLRGGLGCGCGRGCRRRGRRDLAVGLTGARRGGRGRRGRCSTGRSSGVLGGCLARLVVGEEFVPRRVYGSGILEELLVHLLDQPLVGAEL